MSSGTQPRTGRGDNAERRVTAGSGIIWTRFRNGRDGIPACRDAVCPDNTKNCRLFEWSRAHA